MLLLELAQEDIESAGRQNTIFRENVEITFAGVLRQIAELARTQDVTGVRLAFAGEDAQRRGLTCAVASDQPDAVARLDSQRGTRRVEQRSNPGTNFEVGGGNHEGPFYGEAGVPFSTRSLDRV